MQVKASFDILRFVTNDNGAAAIEYVIMTCIMGLMLVPTAAYLASRLQVSYEMILNWF